MMFDARVQAVMDKVDALRHKVDDHWQVPRDEAVLLAQLVRLGRCVSVCEIGTSYGYSTLHLSAATSATGGHVHSFDVSAKKHAAAGAHLAEAGLAEFVTLHLGDARQLLRAAEPRQPFDFAFIDAVKAESFEYLEALWPRLAPRAVLVTDNTRTHAAELAPFVAHLRGLPGVASCAVDVGNGFELTIRG